MKEVCNISTKKYVRGIDRNRIHTIFNTSTNHHAETKQNIHTKSFFLNLISHNNQIYCLQSLDTHIITYKK